MSHKLLLVDDEPFNLELMTELLQDEHFETICAANGEEALALLERDGTSFSTILLDKMMPGINGFDVLKKIKSTPALEFLPVIMQTAVGSPTSVQEGLTAGAFYYLTKPFSRDMLLAVVHAAVSHWDRHVHFKELASQQLGALKHLHDARFELRTHKEAQTVTALLARTCPAPERAATGLFELLVNAIEHGNLAISYQDKSHLQAEDKWENELQQRLNDPELGQRTVSIHFQRLENELVFTIEDMGKGFDWQRYLDSETTSLIASHGRGILIAQKLSFDSLEYHGLGNIVTARVSINAESTAA